MKRIGILGIALVASVHLTVSITLTSAQAASPRQNVSKSLNSLSKNTEQLVQQVQAFLQSSGRWSPAPQGKDMQLCQALQDFQKKVGKMKNDNGSDPFNTVQQDLQMMQFQSQVVEQLLNSQAQSPMVGAAWMQVRNDMLNIGQSMSMPIGGNQANFYDGITSNTNIGGFPNSGFVPGVAPGMPSPYYQQQGSPFYPGANPTNVNIIENSTFDPRPSFQGNYNNFGYNGFNPGTNFNNNSSQINSNVSSNLNGADEQAERFVKQLSNSLQMKGQWPPQQGTPAMTLCQNVQSFQLQLRKLKSDVQSNQSYAVLQSEMRQLGSSSQSIDQLLMQVGVTPDVSSRWNEVRTYMNGAYSAFFSAGSGGYMWMR